MTKIKKLGMTKKKGRGLLRKLAKTGEVKGEKEGNKLHVIRYTLDVKLKTNMIIKKEILKSFNSQNYTAIIQIAGSSKAYLEGIKTARNIAAAEMLTGRTLAVLFLDKNNPADAVVIAVY